MRTTHHTIRALSGVLLATGLLVACGGDDDDSGDDDVASLGTDEPTDTATDASTPEKDPEEAMLEFAECMRDHGVDMPDPQTGPDGQGQVLTMEASPQDNENLEEAQEACEPLMEAVRGDIERDPEREAEMREQLLEYAECMRDHGVDMPDPTFDDSGGVQIGTGGDGADIDPDELDAANEACAEDDMFMAAPSRAPQSED